MANHNSWLPSLSSLYTNDELLFRAVETRKSHITIINVQEDNKKVNNVIRSCVTSVLYIHPAYKRARQYLAAPEPGKGKNVGTESSSRRGTTVTSPRTCSSTLKVGKALSHAPRHVRDSESSSYVREYEKAPRLKENYSLFFPSPSVPSVARCYNETSSWGISRTQRTGLGLGFYARNISDPKAV